MKILKTTILYFAFISVPLMFVFFGTENYATFKAITQISFALIVGLSFKDFFTKKHPLIIKIWFISILVATAFFLLYNILDAIFFYEDILGLIIPLAVLIISYYLFDLKEEKIKKLILIYSLFSIFIGFYLIYTTGGFIILEQYRDIPKNQIAPFFATLAVYSLGYHFFNQKKSIQTYFFLFLGLLIFLFMIFLRSRTSMLAVTFVLIILLMSKTYKIRNYIYALFVIIAFIYFIDYFDFIIDPIYNSMFLNYDTSDLNSISTGRIANFTETIRLISDTPLMGKSFDPNVAPKLFGEYKSIATPHNFLINYILKYGIVGSIPFIAIYFSIVYFVVKEFWKSNKNISILPILIMIVPIFESFGEYSAPFGPGSSYILAYFLFGQYLKKANHHPLVGKHLSNKI